MLKCDQPERHKKTYTIPKVSKKRQAAIDAGTCKPKPKQPIKANPNYKIPARSERRAKQEREYLTKTMPEYKKDHPVCERCNLNDTHHVHHKKGRIEKLLNDTEYFIALCTDCHVWAENNPEDAKAEGISVMRTN